MHCFNLIEMKFSAWPCLRVISIGSCSKEVVSDICVICQIKQKCPTQITDWWIAPWPLLSPQRSNCCLSLVSGHIISYGEEHITRESKLEKQQTKVFKFHPNQANGVIKYCAFDICTQKHGTLSLIDSCDPWCGMGYLLLKQSCFLNC